MTTQQEAYINGFVKRANQYGYSDVQAIELLKESGALNDIVEGAKNFVKNNGFQPQPTQEQRAAYDQRAHSNYARQMPRQPAGQQLPAPVKPAPAQ